LIVEGSKPDKYGRLLVSVWRKSDGANLKDDLLAAGHGHVMSALSQLAPPDLDDSERLLLGLGPLLS
jgi:hypothetical protein